MQGQEQSDSKQNHINKNHVHGQIAQKAWFLFRRPLYWWLAVAVISLSFAPNGWTTLRDRAGYYFDAGNYSAIATDGYVAEGLSAFYPVWPLIMRGINWFGGWDKTVLGWVASVLAAALFGVSLYVFTYWSERFRLHKYEGMVAALLVLSPLSLFRVLPFTESLFSLLLLLLLCDLTADSKGNTTLNLLRCGLWSMLLAATRPMFPFLMVAALMMAIFVAVHAWKTKGLKKHSDQTRSEAVLYGKRLAAVFVAAPLGYLPYGLFCAQKFNDFWKPFHIQAQWGRTLGLHWSVITNPRVINGSNEVLVWDLMGFYLPLVLFLWGLWFFLRRGKDFSLGLQIGFWFSVLIGCAHSAIAFLSHERFVSIGRHVLANPLPFLAVLIALQFVPDSKEKWTRRTLGFVLVASVVFLGMWWFRFVRDQWIG